MSLAESAHIRRMVAADVARLVEIDSSFESPIFLDVVKEVDGLTVTWQLIERPFEMPFFRTDLDFDEQELWDIGARLETGDGLWLVAEIAGTEPDRAVRLVGMVDVARQAWRDAGFVWNIAIDRSYRGHGIGRALMERVFQWGRDGGLRAIILETQTNNWHACRFYQKVGFQLTGIDDHFYTNEDIANKEVALFWTYEL